MVLHLAVCSELILLLRPVVPVAVAVRFALKDFIGVFWPIRMDRTYVSQWLIKLMKHLEQLEGVFAACWSRR